MNFTANEDQRTGTLNPEDIVARLGKLTGSRMRDAMDFRKDGKPSQAREKLIMEIVAERMTNVLVPHYVTPAMQWGIDNEPLAKLAYMEKTGNKLHPCGFIDHPEIEFFGATPDGLVDAGLIEIKCPTTTTFLGWIKAGIVPPEHTPQMRAQMLCTGAKWVDFCAFDQRMPEGKRLFIRRYTPTVEELAKVEAAAIQFLAEVEQLFEDVTTAEMT